MRWAIIRNRTPIRSLGGDLELAREKADALTAETGVPHCVELFSRRYDRLSVGDCFRPVSRKGLGEWALGPVCKKMNELGQYHIVGVDPSQFLGAPESYSMPPEAEVIPWREGEPA